ncbi:hypothetical protein HGA64_05065 [Candidatus Falkowbacteria bacterium]|nr:hypothetical protein [Candidatus Falkowbacteria bacterium]
MKENAQVAVILGCFGFIRVDGLRCVPLIGDEFLISRNPGESYRYRSNNGIMAIACPEGDVWIGQPGVLSPEAFRMFEPVSKSINVPCSNQERISTCDLIARNTDPNWIPPYHMSEEARRAGFTGN